MATSTKSSRSSSGRKYGRTAGKRVESAMRRRKSGTLRRGKHGHGGRVTSPRQAVAIGLSEAREEGAMVPPAPIGSESEERESSRGRAGGARKRSARKGGAKRASARTGATARKTGARKAGTRATGARKAGARKAGARKAGARKAGARKA
ncbi:MAG TPA: DUF6496 domain-containing protein, partial [Gemmatimonadaceae bacterium]|nr:DUF6496 domain-containing protein [Gemmatimonadaceae bacterium]